MHYGKFVVFLKLVFVVQGEKEFEKLIPQKQKNIFSPYFNL